MKNMAQSLTIGRLWIDSFAFSLSAALGESGLPILMLFIGKAEED